MSGSDPGSSGPYCAHTRVVRYRTEPSPGHVTAEWWACQDCEVRFSPTPFYDKDFFTLAGELTQLKAELEERRMRGRSWWIKVVGLWRIWWGLCPICNSDAGNPTDPCAKPTIDNCKWCHGSRGWKNKKQRKAWGEMWLSEKLS
jgi:hypothetical protein